MLRKYLFRTECVCDVLDLSSAFHICIKLILTRVVRSKMNIRISNEGHLGNGIALSTQTVTVVRPSNSIEFGMF
jgi:hypothetical protein